MCFNSAHLFFSKKRKKCTNCKSIIQVGELYQSWAGKQDDFGYGKNCLTCAYFLAGYKYKDGVDDDEFFTMSPQWILLKQMSLEEKLTSESSGIRLLALEEARKRNKNVLIDSH